METTALKEKLHSLIDSSSKEKLIEVYSLFEDDYIDQFKFELDEEYTGYQNTGEVTSREEMDKAIETLLRGK